MATRAVKPGEIVVPLKDIVDRLGGKLTQGEIDELVQRIVTGRREVVRPGDLITADLMNFVLTRLEDLSTRVAGLEVGRPGSGGSGRGVVIREPGSSTELRIGDRLTIRGENLLAESVVEIDNQMIGGFRASGDNTSLVLDSIPSSISVSGNGRDVDLLVTNTAGTDSVRFRLKPRELTRPIGTVAVANSAGPTPAPPPTGYEKGRTYTFVFTITADVRPDENFILTPQMSNGWTARMVGDSEIPIRAARDSRTPTVGTVSVTVQIPGTANDGDTGDLTLTVESKRNAAIKDRSQEVKITVGGAAQAPRTMAVSLIGTAGLDAAMRVNADGTKTGFATAGGTNGGEFLLEVHAPAAGAYKVDTTKLAKFLSDPTPAKWSATVSGSATGQVTLVAGRNTVPVTVAALTGAQPAKLVFEIVSNANPNESGYFELAVEPM